MPTGDPTDDELVRLFREQRTAMSHEEMVKSLEVA